MTGQEIRQRFLQHFERREHLILDSAPLVPTDDPTTLFISAGMQPLQPYYKGLRPPPAPRLASCQKCFRTGDPEEVGRTDRHLTFFEIGNFAIKVSRDMAERHPATSLAPLQGRGGGRSEMAQGKLTRPLAEAFELVEAALK